MDLAAALEFSRYAFRLRAADPALFADVAARVDVPLPWDDAAFRDIGHPADGAALARLLRRRRQQVFLTILLRDLTGRADLAEVCGSIGRFAEIAVGAAVAAHHRWLAVEHGEPRSASTGEPQQMIVVAMGKLGGGELNVSSDLDLVFIYPDDGTTDGVKPLANQEFFDKLGRRVIAALANVTADGYVFRIDMRLRPYGDAGPLTSTFSALEQYLVAQGRTWERYAWLKARPLTGDRGAELEALIAPFVFRKYLDYDAYAGLRDVHRQIREQGRRKDYVSNIKVGPGGIREIEFIVQALQLVRGGRDAALRVRGTLPALEALRARQLLPSAAVVELSEAYRFLRRLEHRLQYRDDAQTHDVPTDAVERAAIAAVTVGSGAGAFDQLLQQHRLIVERHFEALFGDPAGESDPLAAVWLAPATDEAQLASLRAIGYSDPQSAIGELLRLRRSPRYLQLPMISRERFDALVPLLLRAASLTADAQAVFTRLLALLEAISGRSVYLALLVEHPPVLPRLAQLMAASAWAALYLTQHPILLDELLDSRVLLAEPDWAEWRNELDRDLAVKPDDTERQMDALRHFQHAQLFRLLAQDLTGQLTVERLADHLSILADIVLAAAVKYCWMQVSGGDTPPKFAVIGYGKLGGKELGYASDLDLVFIYDDPDDNAAQRYARLAHRLTTWLTSTTAAGRLYDTDLRLRPDGASGLPVSSLASFCNYQREHAWTWEHQALTRARFVAGDQAIGAAFDVEREAILRKSRDPLALAADVIAMRRRMHAEHPNRSEHFDLKHDPGGMVDVEFIVQYLVLAHSHERPELTQNVGNIALLGMAAAMHLLPEVMAATVADAYREYRRLQHHVRLQGAAEARVDPQPQIARRAAVGALWTHVFGEPWVN